MQGFTLSELMIASTITGVILAVASVGLFTMIQVNDRSDEQARQRVELNRALDFITDDIREATTISHTVPPGWTDSSSAEYRPLFYLLKPTGTGIAYYDHAATEAWRGPRVVYRLEPTDGDLTSRTFQQVGRRGHALVDAITATAPTCQPLPGSSAGRPVGLRIFIADSQTAKVCLAGQLSRRDSLSLETQVATRGQP